jgi:hypothetical protein
MSMIFQSIAIWWVLGHSGPALEPLGRLDVQAIPEASGIVKSRRHAGIFWVHNDSGNPPLLFAIDGEGRIVRQYRVAVPNIDWEDIAIDDQGHLYLGDIGNNMGVLPVRTIYRIDEPDPRSKSDQPLKPSATTFYALPRSNRFDAESLVYERGAATLVAKYRDGRPAELFSVALEPPSPLARPTQPRFVGRLTGFTEAATGAALSTDRSLLAVCAATVTRVYRRDDSLSPPWKFLAEVRYPSLPVEGIAWDGGNLVLVAEGGGLYRLSEQKWRAMRAASAGRAPAQQAPVPRAKGGGKDNAR